MGKGGDGCKGVFKRYLPVGGEGWGRYVQTILASNWSGRSNLNNFQKEIQYINTVSLLFEC